MIKLLSPKEKAAQVADAVRRIKLGEVVSVIDASGSAHSLCIGDFRDIGWSERVATRRSLYYTWNGPVPIVVDGQTVNPGGTTEETEVDWS